MNPGSVVKGATNTAAKQAGNQVTKQVGNQVGNQVANQASNQMVNQVGSKAQQMAPQMSNNLPTNPTSVSAPNATDALTEGLEGNSQLQSNNIPTKEQTSLPEPSSDRVESLETPQENFEYETNSEPTEQPLEQGLSTDPNAPQPGDKVDAGKEINEKGEVEDTATKKTVKAVGRGVAAYFTGGESLEMDQAITNNEIGDKVIGVVSDVLEKDPSVKALSEALDETGVADLANDAMDVAGDVMNGDIGSAIEHAEKTKEHLDESKKKIRKRMATIIISAASAFLFFIMVFLVVLGPVIGGTMYLTDKIGDVYTYVKDKVSDYFENIELDIIDSITYQQMLDEIPDFNKLNERRQSVLSAAASIVGAPYYWGGKPTGAGIEGVPTTGLDCSGYVQWVFWTALGEKPTYSYTGHFYNHPDFYQINKEDLMPGDICLYATYDVGPGNHVAIYAGDGVYYHASNGVERNKKPDYNCVSFYRNKYLGELD